MPAHAPERLISKCRFPPALVDSGAVKLPVRQVENFAHFFLPAAAVDILDPRGSTLTESQEESPDLLPWRGGGLALHWSQRGV